MEARVKQRRRVVVDDRPLAAAIGTRIRAARQRAGLTQQALAGDRYTKAYISALETGVAKPSMAALNYLSSRLGMPASAFVSDTETAWTRIDADLRLASGDFEAALEGYTDLLAVGPPPAEKASILAGMAEALCRLDRGQEAIRPASEAVALFTQLGRTAERNQAKYWLGHGQYAADNLDEARAILRGVLDDVRSGLEPAPDFVVRLLIALSVVDMHAGNTKVARGYLEEADGLTRSLDARRQAAYLHALATGYRRAGDYEAAIRAGMQALALFRAADAERDAANIANNLALVYLDNGSTKRAQEMVRLGRETAERLGDQRILAHLADTEARVALAGSDIKGAADLVDEAVALSERSGNRKALLDALITKAKVLIESERGEEAIATYEHAAELARSVGPSARRREVLGAWADTLAKLGRHDQAYELMREAMQGGR
jgi:tetratricopeptide (TPR) repeat protein